jgi:hypothetical protein
VALKSRRKSVPVRISAPAAGLARAKDYPGGVRGSLRNRPGVAAIITLIIGVPAGYALADTAGLAGGTGPNPAGDAASPVYAEDCPAAAAIWEEAGMPRDTFSGRCPTAEEATEHAREIVGLRKRGLERIEEAIARYGEPSDADDLAAIRAELQQLHVPD